jgi:hypothetical protein
MSNKALDHYAKNCPKRQYYVLSHFDKANKQKEKRNDKTNR